MHRTISAVVVTGFLLVGWAAPAGAANANDQLFRNVVHHADQKSHLHHDQKTDRADIKLAKKFCAQFAAGNDTNGKLTQFVEEQAFSGPKKLSDKVWVKHVGAVLGGAIVAYCPQFGTRFDKWGATT